MEALLLNKWKYCIASFFMMMFVVCDLMFDFLFSFNGHNIVSLMFTLGASLIVFVCTWNVKKTEIINQVDGLASFIRSNFDKAQVVFSILDIVCGIISVCSSILVFSCIFKAVKLVYIPTKILVVCNKEKTLIKPIIQFSLVWASVRLINKKGGAMFEFLKRNKWTLIFGTILGGLATFATIKVLPLYFTLPLWLVIVLSVVAFCVIFAIAYFLGSDTAKSILFRVAKNFLPADQYEQLVSICDRMIADAKEKQEDERAKQIAEKRFNLEKKAELKASQKAEKKVNKESTTSAKLAFEEKIKKELDALKQADGQNVTE
jgi:hypothetical protein